MEGWFCRITDVTMQVLVINAGSSSIKYRLFEMPERAILVHGIVEKIGESVSRAVHFFKEKEKIVSEKNIPDHKEGMREILEAMKKTGNNTIIRSTFEVEAVGHRVVHGGERFKTPAFINNEVLNAIKQNIPLAPLHNPANLAGIEAGMEMFPDAPHVAVFDTAFHQTMPTKAFLYAIPYHFYEKHKIRKYGFHGTSHAYVTKAAAQYLGGKVENFNFITVHLGNGASISAIEKGKCVETSMGMTPLEGLMMGTRCGDIDPAVIFFLAETLGIDIKTISDILNKKSGLKGIGGSNDMREIIENAFHKNKFAELAIEMYTHRVKKYIGAYYAILGKVDALIFTGGVGENAPLIRAKILSGLSEFGIEMDNNKNNSAAGHISDITSAKGKVKLLLIPTNEELEIAIQTFELLQKLYKTSKEQIS